MMRNLSAAVVAIALAGPSLAVAGSSPAGSSPLPSAYAPRPDATNHVYGSPIGQPVVGETQVARHKPTPADGPIEKKPRVAKRPRRHNTKTSSAQVAAVQPPSPR